MSEEKRKALDRIVKLVRLAANNPNEEEARSAALRACQMMVEHKVTLRLTGVERPPTANPTDVPGAPPKPPTPQPEYDFTDFMRMRYDAQRDFKTWEKQFWDHLRRGPGR
jgi:hypothetical protein